MVLHTRVVELVLKFSVRRSMTKFSPIYATFSPNYDEVSLIGDQTPVVTVFSDIKSVPVHKGFNNLEYLPTMHFFTLYITLALAVTVRAILTCDVVCSDGS